MKELLNSFAKIFAFYHQLTTDGHRCRTDPGKGTVLLPAFSRKKQAKEERNR